MSRSPQNLHSFTKKSSKIQVFAAKSSKLRFFAPKTLIGPKWAHKQNIFIFTTRFEGSSEPEYANRTNNHPAPGVWEGIPPTAWASKTHEPAHRRMVEWIPLGWWSDAHAREGGGWALKADRLLMPNHLLTDLHSEPFWASKAGGPQI